MLRPKAKIPWHHGLFAKLYRPELFSLTYFFIFVAVKNQEQHLHGIQEVQAD